MIVLGLIVVVTIYVFSAVTLTWMVARALKSRTSKRRAVALMTLAFILAPTLDEVAGRIYFEWLCAREGGVTVYETVALEREHWDENGNPKFIDATGNLQEAALGYRYRVHRTSIDPERSLFNIRETSLDVIDTSSSSNLAVHKSFIYFGGWLRNSTGLVVRGVSCHTETGFYQNFLQELFRQKK